jgi:WD40 repeat protein
MLSLGRAPAVVWVCCVWFAVGCGGGGSPSKDAGDAGGDRPDAKTDAPAANPDATTDASSTEPDGATDVPDTAPDATTDTPTTAPDGSGGIDGAADVATDAPASGTDGGVQVQACGVLGRGSATFAAIAPGGDSFVLADEGLLELRQWSATPTVQLTNGLLGASAVAYSADGTHLAAATHTGVNVWRLSDNTLERQLPDLTQALMVASSGDGSVVIIGRPPGLGPSRFAFHTPAGTTTIGDAGARVPLAVGVSLDGTTVFAAFTIDNSPVSRLMPIGYRVRAWHTSDGSTAWTALLGVGTMAAVSSSMVFSKDGSLMAVGPFDQSGGQGYLIQTATGAAPTILPLGVGTLGKPARFYDDGSAVIAYGVGSPTTVTIFRTSNGTVASTRTLPSPVMAAGLGATGSVETILQTPPSIELAADGVAVATVPVTPAGTLDALSRDGTLALTDGDPVQLWSIPSGSVLRTVAAFGVSGAFSPNGMLFTYYKDAVSIDHVTAGSAVSTTSAGRAVAFSPDGTLLATANTDSTAQLWSTATGALVRTLWKDVNTGHTQQLTSVAFAPDGATVATAALDGTVKLWVTATGDLVRTMTVPAGASATSLVFALDGLRLFGVGAVGVTQLFAWDVGTGASMHVPSVGQSNVVLSAAGDTLLVGGTDQVLRFRAADLTTLAPLDTPGGVAESIGLSADGHTLAISTRSDLGNNNRAVRIWCLP